VLAGQFRCGNNPTLSGPATRVSSRCRYRHDSPHQEIAARDTHEMLPATNPARARPRRSPPRRGPLPHRQKNWPNGPTTRRTGTPRTRLTLPRGSVGPAKIRGRLGCGECDRPAFAAAPAVRTAAALMADAVQIRFGGGVTVRGTAHPGRPGRSAIARWSRDDRRSGRSGRSAGDGR